MSYQYTKLTPDKLNAVAGEILRRFPNRRGEISVDVEGIVDDLDIRVIPRRGGLRKHTPGYMPADPRFIVVAEEYSSFPPAYRWVVAEELCHLILEFKLWENGVIPNGTNGHEISPEQHSLIEHDATYLAACRT